MTRHAVSTLRFILLVVLLTACTAAATPDTPTALPTTPIPSTPTPQPPTTEVIGGITQIAVSVTLENGTGAPCTDSTVYAVKVELTSNGLTTAKYDISASTASGQSPNGFFENYASPAVSDGLAFDSAQSQAISLRLMGPYNAGPDSILIHVRVNGGNWYDALISCATGEATAGGTTGSTGGITATNLSIMPEPNAEGAVCTEAATYSVALDITTNGPTTARYEISATDASGQVPDGIFDGFGAPSVADGIAFDGAGTQTIALRLTKPYSYPDTITIRARVNGGEFQHAQVVCK